MLILEMLYYATLVLYFFLILDLIFTIINTKSNLEWKIAKVVNSIFLALLFLSANRLVGRIPNTNMFDYLLLVLNAGLFLVGSFTSRHIMKK